MNNLKILNTLADETRYNIYEYVLQNKKSFTVQEIAEQFSIHPNVARLHLTKLCEIGIVNAEFLNSGKGGRPGRVYNASENGISISFPKRDHEKLLNWTLQYISYLGNEAIEKLKLISYEDGYNEMTLLLNQRKQTMSFDEKIEFLTISSKSIGYVPSVIEKDDIRQFQFTIYNCPFKDQLAVNPHLICNCHESYLQGQVDALFPNNDFIQIDRMSNRCSTCQYEINIKDSH